MTAPLASDAAVREHLGVAAHVVAASAAAVDRDVDIDIEGEMAEARAVETAASAVDVRAVLPDLATRWAAALAQAAEPQSDPMWTA